MRDASVHNQAWPRALAINAQHQGAFCLLGMVHARRTYSGRFVISAMQSRKLGEGPVRDGHEVAIQAWSDHTIVARRQLTAEMMCLATFWISMTK